MIKVEELINNLKFRAGLNVAQAVLRSCKLPTARSWTEVAAIIIAAVKTNPDLYDRLISALSVQLICDLKATSYYDIDTVNALGLQETLLNIPVVKGDLADAFPLSVEIKKISKDNGDLKAVHIFSDSHGVGVVFSRKRVFSVSEEYSRDKFTSQLLVEFPNHDKIIAIKDYYHQTFDVAYFNVAHNVLELRADITRSDSLLQTVKQQEKSIADLKAFVQVLLFNVMKVKVLAEPRNLFPLIKRIYADPAGAIKKLGFSTTSGSIKTETMKGGIDLRKEPFHLNGAKAINHEMTLFEISIIWHRKDIDNGNSTPELYVPGNHMNSVSLEPRCDFALLKGIRTNDDSNFVLTKIASF
ncbi:hypothetical protein MQC82_04560 [Pseudomonas viridiflava]|uniref:hypothetical protein n=1 Tax=Pseudomonas viridiflava TaxID=33069 RepID=UPI001F622335|nr:hypothetical protein [Pseudomonas viridiflava]MCI3908831.1 hypothetical protein [Pseudomonas viridiflava]